MKLEEKLKKHLLHIVFNRKRGKEERKELVVEEAERKLLHKCSFPGVGFTMGELHEGASP